MSSLSFSSMDAWTDDSAQRLVVSGTVSTQRFCHTVDKRGESKEKSKVMVFSKMEQQFSHFCEQKLKNSRAYHL